MPVPKRKTSKSRRDSRSSTKFIRPQAITKCLNCEYPINPHEICNKCGHYKGKKILVTKLERALKRNEVRSALQEKNARKEEQMQAAQSSQEKIEESSSKH